MCKEHVPIAKYLNLLETFDIEPGADTHEEAEGIRDIN